MEKYAKLEDDIKKIITQTKGNICISFFDLDTKQGFSINGNKKVQSASIIKILIMVELMYRVSKNDFSLSEKIYVPNTLKTDGDGILKELLMDHYFSLQELMILMIILSDNQATNILIELLGIENINQTAKKLGLNETSLGRKMMDIEARKNGYDNYTSANDTAHLLKLIYNGELIDESFSQLMLNTLLKQQQGERLQRYLPNNIKIAHKCGELENLENDAGIFFLSNKTYILVVLASNISSNLSAKQLIGKISQTIYQNLEG